MVTPQSQTEVLTSGAHTTVILREVLVAAAIGSKECGVCGPPQVVGGVRQEVSC